MPEARLEVTDALGRRIVRISKEQFAMGRRMNSDLHLPSGEVSRDHAEIVRDASAFVLRDRGSRYGTFVNDQEVKEHTLADGDRICLGRSGGAEMVFLLAETPSPTEETAETSMGPLNRTGFLGDLISWEDGVYGTFKSVFSGGARACRSDGRGAPGGPRISVGGAAVGGTEARLHGGDAAEVGAAGAA